MAEVEPKLPAAGTASSTWLGHPRGLFVLFGVEMWERFSYYGMRAILGLYLKCAIDGMANPPDGAVAGFNPGRGWLKEDANNLVGWYGGMAYLLPIFGGLIADKLIGTHRSMVVGGLLIALGHIVLAISGFGELAMNRAGMDLFVFGLALIVIGTGHFKPTVTVMVSQLYPEGDARRESAFSIFYMGINVGAFLGVAICSYLGERVGWHWGFGAAAVGMLSGLAMYLTTRPMYLAEIGLPRDGRGAAAPGFLVGGIVMAGVVATCFRFGILSRLDAVVSAPWFVWSALAAAVITATLFTLAQKPADRAPITAIFIFTLFNAVFWLAYEQAATSINFFTDEKTERHIGTFLVPTGWFQNINPFAIVLIAPLFGWIWMTLAKRGRDPSQPCKIGLGLICVGLGYLFMVWAGIQAKGAGLAGMWLIAATYLWHTLGEIILSPTGLSFVTKTAPKQHVSLLMGIWYLSSFLAMVVGGKLAGLTGKIEKGEIKLPWSFGGQADFFFLFVVSSLGAGVLILLLTPLLKKLTAERVE